MIPSIERQREANYRLLYQIAIGIEKLLHPFCEVVIHDFSDLEHSIIYMAGNISGRSVGGAATDLLLSQAKEGDTAQDFYNYETRLPNGKRMKSCTMFLRDEDNSAYGAFCVNFDISLFAAIYRLLGELISTDSEQDVTETLSDDLHSTVHALLMDVLNSSGVELPILNRDEKVELIARLDDKGIFQVKKAVPILADELGLSRSTIYNYLSEARGERMRQESVADE